MLEIEWMDKDKETLGKKNDRYFIILSFCGYPVSIRIKTIYIYINVSCLEQQIFRVINNSYICTKNFLLKS